MGVIEARRRILLSAPHPVTTTPAPVASFNTDMVGKLRSAKFGFLPVQAGSGDPSPTNVRPISGWDGLTVEQAGKNLFDISNGVYSGYYINGSGVFVAGSSEKTVVCKLPAGTYHFSKPVQTVILRAGLFDDMPVGGSASYYLYPAGSNIDLTFTLAKASYFAAFVYNNVGEQNAWQDVLNSIQIELGSTATPYAPYTGSTYPVSWQSEAGTIYGGYEDLVRGEVVVTHKMIHFVKSYIAGVVEYSSESGTAKYQAYSANIATGKIGGLGFCDKLKNGAPNIIYNALIYKDGNAKRLIIGLPEELSTLTLVRDWMDSIGGFDYVYELETPVVYPITTQVLKSLRGVNNVWSNTNGTIDLSYWTH